MITIIDYHMGNLGSIANMLKKLGFQSTIASSANEVQRASKLILPGVGAFDHAMGQLADLDLLTVLSEKVIMEKTPILGICLGMQLLARKSEEGQCEGLGWIDAEVIKFKVSDLPVPHMGWNFIRPKKDNPLITSLDENSRFYFVHSYHFSCRREEDILTETSYGIRFVSAVARDNVYGVQFHPEKSHRFGMTILKNFAEVI